VDGTESTEDHVK